MKERIQLYKDVALDLLWKQETSVLSEKDEDVIMEKLDFIWDSLSTAGKLEIEAWSETLNAGKGRGRAKLPFVDVEVNVGDTHLPRKVG